jgi:hypothetical protein
VEYNNNDNNNIEGDEIPEKLKVLSLSLFQFVLS